MEAEKWNDDGLFRVLYYGTFIPNHGVEYIIEAARLLNSDQAIRFELIGRRPDRARAVEPAERYDLSNARFVTWLEKQDLLERITISDVCLGAVDTTPQSLMTVQDKIYKALAMAKLIITGESRAVNRILQQGTHLYLCECANPQSLADAIWTLKADPHGRRHLAEHGHRPHGTQFDLNNNGARHVSHLRQPLSSSC